MTNTQCLNPKCGYETNGFVCTKCGSGQAYLRLEQERDALQAELTRLSGKTGFCRSCEDYAIRLAEVTNLLAKERDAWGKRETEIMQERDAVKAELIKAINLNVEQTLKTDRWKAEVETTIRAATAWQNKLTEQRDIWKKLAGELAEAARKYIEGYGCVGNSVMLDKLRDKVAAYDSVARGKP